MQELCKELKLPKQLLECTSAEMIQVLSRIPLHSSLNGDDGAADQTRAGTPIIHTPCLLPYVAIVAHLLDLYSERSDKYTVFTQVVEVACFGYS